MSDKNREELKKKATVYHEEAHAVVCRHYGACIGFPRTARGEIRSRNGMPHSRRGLGSRS